MGVLLQSNASRAGLHKQEGSLTHARQVLLPLRKALQKPSGSLTSTQVSISENWFMMGRMTSMELPTCRSDLFPTKIMGILRKKDRASESTSETTPLSASALPQPCVLPGSRTRSPPDTPLQGPQQLSCLPRLGASIWRNRRPDPAYAFTQQQYVQEPLIQHSSLLPKQSTHRLWLLCSRTPLEASSPCLAEKRSRGEGTLSCSPLPQLDW